LLDLWIFKLHHYPTITGAWPFNPLSGQQKGAAARPRPENALDFVRVPTDNLQFEREEAPVLHTWDSNTGI
jgi:hypothetical protein